MVPMFAAIVIIYEFLARWVGFKSFETWIMNGKTIFFLFFLHSQFDQLLLSIEMDTRGEVSQIFSGVTINRINNF